MDNNNKHNLKLRLIVIAVVVVLIAIIAAIGLGKPVVEKYTYGTDYADLQTYYKVGTDELRVYFGDEKTGSVALLRGGVCYFPMGTVRDYLTDGFYEDSGAAEPALLYTSPDTTWKTFYGGQSYTDGSSTTDMGITTCFMVGDTLYVAADYVNLFAPFAYEVYDARVRILTTSGSYTMMEVNKDTQIRILGGIKSEILRDVKQGEKVKLLEEMEEWSKVETDDFFIGYIENKRMDKKDTETESLSSDMGGRLSIPVHEYPADRALNGKVALGFHAVASTSGNDTIYEMMNESECINVIAPTWYSLTDDQGGFRSFATADYVSIAHNAGLQVWGVADDFNYQNETGTAISDHAIFADTNSRTRLISGLVASALEVGLDGINLDFEDIGSESGEAYGQFIKEMSVACKNAGLVFSLDNYVPYNYNSHYRLDVQGEFADYVILMGYDEHYLSGGVAGSVASISYVSYGLDQMLLDVPASKIVNALPFYMIQWKTEGGVTTGKYVTIANLEEYLAKYQTISPSWNEETCQNYMEWTSGGANYQIWLEDADSISVKLNVMNAKKIGGVAAWRLGYGTKQIWSLIGLYAEN